MLQYLITITEDLTFLCVLLGLMYAYFSRGYGARERWILTGGVLLGLATGAVMSWYKNNTKLIHTGVWNLRILLAAAPAVLLFFLFAALHRARKPGLRSVSGLLAAIAGGVAVAAIILYIIPDVYAYPKNFVSIDMSILSTAFLYKLIGYLLGLVLMYLVLIGVNRVCRAVPGGLVAGMTHAALLLFLVRFAARSLQHIRTTYPVFKELIPFRVVQHSGWFANRAIYAALIIGAVLAVVAIVKSMTYREPYNTPAERRKIDARWLSHRRWAWVLLVCLILCLVIVTAVKAWENRAVELSPTEEVEIVGDDVVVSLDRVEDGHLHRFGYTTDNGVTVRFIVIKKPNSRAYGVGLDACDICGETGYYERGGQVVCKLCDVVMNINTIGFKGGCNPIVIDYAIEDGQLIISRDELARHEKTFNRR